MLSRIGNIFMRFFAEGFIGLGLVGYIVHDALLPQRAIYRPN